MEYNPFVQLNQGKMVSFE